MANKSRSSDCEQGQAQSQVRGLRKDDKDQYHQENHHTHLPTYIPCRRQPPSPPASACFSINTTTTTPEPTRKPRRRWGFHGLLKHLPTQLRRAKCSRSHRLPTATVGCVSSGTDTSLAAHRASTQLPDRPIFNGTCWTVWMDVNTPLGEKVVRRTMESTNCRNGCVSSDGLSTDAWGQARKTEAGFSGFRALQPDDVLDMIT